MRFLNIASGSKGNATLIYEGDTLIQIDMGVRICDAREALKRINKKIPDIQALLITHEHSDHIKSVYCYRDRVPVYASEGTMECDYTEIKPFSPFVIGDFNIVPFSTHHDALNPLGFLIEGRGDRLAYVTDTGMLDDEVLELLRDCDYYYFESNHDLKMLKKSKRPKWLIDRIRSDCGHLNNVDSAIYMSELIGPHTKQIYLAHLSEECNTPEIALKSYYDTFERKGINHTNIIIKPCAQHCFTFGGEGVLE